MEFAQHVKSQVDIVRVVSEFVPTLKKKGPHRWLGLCPFHNEKTPSFSVNENLQYFKCFGCGQGGDVFSFLMEVQGLSFFEALNQLAEQHGIPIPKRGKGEFSDEETRLRAALYRMHEIAQSFFERQLQSAEGTAARDYVDRRGLDAAAIESFGVGYAPAAGNRLLTAFQKEGFASDQIEASGIVGRSEDRGSLYDRFRNRVMFPIKNETGKIVAFAGRALDPDQPAKYINSPETAIYKKSFVLYNLHRAKEHIRRENRVVLVEGYMDAIGVARAGVGEVVAPCGTALTPQQVRTLRRLAGTVVVNFDADQAGQNATERSIQLLLEEGVKVLVLNLPDGKDPDDFCKKHGAEAYQKLLAGAPGYFTWLAERARQRFDVRTSDGRVAAFQFLMPSVNLLPDKLERVSLVNELAERLGVERSLVLDQFRRSAVERREPPPMPQVAQPLSHGERLVLRALIELPEARQSMLAEALDVARSDSLAIAPILESMAAIAQSGTEFQFTALESRLDERGRNILTRAAFDDHDLTVTVEDGRTALSALQRNSCERRYRAVRREIAEAENSGDRKKAIELLGTKMQLEKKLGMLGKGRGAEPGSQVAVN